MAERYFQQTLPNGLSVVCEKMSAMQSAAMTLLVPAGAATDPAHFSGSSTVLSDLVLRGAGERDSRQLTDHLDRLGLQRSSSVGVHHTRFGASALAARVMEGLAAYADIVRRPRLPDSEFGPARDLAVQSLASVEDEPRQKVLIKLRESHFPWPLGRNTMGEKADLEALTCEACREDHAARYRPDGAILAVAGDVDFAAAADSARRLFGDWAGAPAGTLSLRLPAQAAVHVEHKSEQTHIGIAYPSIQETDGDYYVMRMAVEILGGGMSSRLFTEIREKRALVYAVWLGYGSVKGLGSIMGYAGTSNDRAQATLDTFVAELHRFAAGATADELERAKTGLKAATIMQGESTGARSGAIAHDWFMRGRIRTLDEIKSAIDAVTLDRLNAWLKANPPGRFTIVTVGPKPLKADSL